MTSTTIPCLAIAEARLALEYLGRAEKWAAGVDESIADEMILVHHRLEERIEALRSGPNWNAAPDGEGPGLLS
jgi:hypothetical protein